MPSLERSCEGCPVSEYIQCKSVKTSEGIIQTSVEGKNKVGSKNRFSKSQTNQESRNF